MLRKSILLISIVLVLDQVLKFYIKTNFSLGQELPVFGQYFKLYFIENPGMAFGMEFGGSTGKVILTFVRILAAAFIWYIIASSIKKNEHKLLIVSLSLIFAGAVGNIIDSIFYGVIFSESDFLLVAQSFPEGGGYAGLFKGKVVDMFYAPIINTNWPNWVPIFGGKELIFFRPIFNVADASISVGVGILLVFYKRIFPNTKGKTPDESISENPIKE